MHVLALRLLIGFALLTSVPAAAEEQVLPGTLEEIAALSISPGNLAVSAEGRIFATVHPFRRAEAQLIEVTGPSSYRPWPDASWNGAFASGSYVLNSPLGIAIDRQERLWVLDTGRGEPPQPPKLLAFSLADGRVVFRYDFPPETGPVDSFLNDLAVDDERGFVYIADVGGSHEPALVWVDLNTHRSRRFTASPNLRAEDVDLVVEGRVIGFEDADGEFQPARIAVNPITLSGDGETLYFGAMSGETWYRLPTQLLRDGAADDQIAAAIERAGHKPVSDGASTDTEGNHFFTDLGNNAITMLRPDGKVETPG
ncbi:hypothetical protein CKO22_00265 [Thiococcus pfennigii]|nr:L-dopachrome tautomerase-related protein [Thiococcus pfennigii]MBK1699395.1 hypothetical protein [Thiococcus pfennigii]